MRSRYQLISDYDMYTIAGRKLNGMRQGPSRSVTQPACHGPRRQIMSRNLKQ